MVNYSSFKEKMFRWEEKRNGLWSFSCKRNSNMLYDVKFYRTDVFSHWMQHLERIIFAIYWGDCFTFTALAHSLFDSSSCMLCGKQLFCEKGNISAATFYSSTGDCIDYSSCRTKKSHYLISQQFAQRLKTFFSPILKLYHLKKELVYTAGRTWHFRFKFVIPFQMPHPTRARFKFPTHGKVSLTEFSSSGTDVSKMSVGCPEGRLLKLRIDRYIGN